MGCPDWPKCFGSWVPPTSEAQLSPSYREDYKNLRIAKNERVAKLMAGFGADSLAHKIVHDPSVQSTEEFNVTKTWIEYINRLIGVLIGLFIIISAVLSLRYWTTNRRIVMVSWLAVLLVIFQGWLGSIVVSVNLMPWSVTVHMLLAVVLVAMLIWCWAESMEGSYIPDRADTRWPRASIAQDATAMLPFAWLVLIFSVIQMVLGTDVREAIDLAFSSNPDRSEIIERVWDVFVVHRSFSWAVVIANAYFAFLMLRSYREAGLFRNGTFWMVTLVLLNILLGVILAYFGFPAWAQPLHLTFGSVLIGVQLMLLITLRKAKRNRSLDFKPKVFGAAN